MSFGVASFPDDALTFEELLHKASAKLLPSDQPGLSVARSNDTDSQS
jgi:hypothetical protein